MSVQEQAKEYVPAGSYQRTSQNINVTITALCQKTDGSWVQSPPLSYSANQAGTITDLANMNGVLTLFTDNPANHNVSDNLGPFVPAGSYQRTSQQVSVTLNAVCQKIDGQWVPSQPLNYTAEQAANANDIANRDGNLRLE